MNIFGSSNPSGIGGTAVTVIRYQFAVEPLAAGLPATVPIQLSMAGYVSVDTSPTGSIGAIGHTFARINTPAGQFQAQNYDAQGSYEGVFDFSETRAINVTADTAQTIVMQVNSHGQGSRDRVLLQFVRVSRSAHRD